jgi:hypothetical protein
MTQKSKQMKIKIEKIVDGATLVILIGWGISVIAAQYVITKILGQPNS